MAVIQTDFVIHQDQFQVQFYEEVLDDDVTLQMMSIPGGSFLMGSPDAEQDRRSSEGPQHEVTVAAFSLGKYPVTQAQWKIVSAFPQVNRQLKPDPSHFKGDRLPVESISWHEAVEFCGRLKAHTTRSYRLPTEAEWEYACRAGTNTPFHFGETITTELANYRGTDSDYWSGSYGNGPKGEYRAQTTPVDNFDAANAFGLCDMHGNVWEWCQDYWHGNYEGASSDGSAWLNENNNDSQRVIRGGSCLFSPRYCRSACRNLNYPDLVLGFRVAFSVPRTF